MLDLPKSTEMSKQLPKKAIYERFKATPHNQQKIRKLVNSFKTIMQLPQIAFARQPKLNCQEFSVS